MQTITVHLTGGPLDGTKRKEHVPEHWRVLRIEHRQRGKLHVYSGLIEPHSPVVPLSYVGTEKEESTA